MEESAKIKKITWLAFIQCIIIICCVWFAANWIYGYDSKTVDENYVDKSHMGLPVSSSDRVKDYPDYIFKSNKKWNVHKETLLASDACKRVDGIGKISKSSINLDCILTENGSILGRYHNENGINLDVNGYIEAETNQLKIKLGHESETSYLILSPIENEKSNQSDEYSYSGTWGKKQLPAEISFKIIE